MKKSLFCVACSALLAAQYAAGASALAQQQKYPVKPIRVIVPYAPGGGVDVVARVISQKLSETFAQPVVVDNRAGGGGTIGFSHLIVALWNREVVKLLLTPDMKDRLTNAGIDAAGGPPARFRDALRLDIERWQKVVKAANIKGSD